MGLHAGWLVSFKKVQFGYKDRHGVGRGGEDTQAIWLGRWTNKFKSPKDCQWTPEAGRDEKHSLLAWVQASSFQNSCVKPHNFWYFVTRVALGPLKEGICYVVRVGQGLDLCRQDLALYPETFDFCNDVPALNWLLGGWWPHGLFSWLRQALMALLGIWAAITKSFWLGGLQTEIYFSQFWRLGSPTGWIFGNFWLIGSTFLAVSSWWWKGWKSSLVLIPSWGLHLPWPPLRAHLLMPTPWG
jgi:hypothetical protein